MVIQPKYCRSCGVSNPSPETSLTQTWHRKSLAEIFEECVGLKIVGDNFSKIQCNSCYKKLIDSYNFRMMSQETHAKLVKEVGDLEIKKEDEESEEIKEEMIVTPLLLKEDDYDQSVAYDDETFVNYVSDDDDDKDSKPEMVPKKKRVSKPRERIGSVCLGCKQTFKSDFRLKKHMNENKSDPDHLWRCYDCPETFEARKDLDLHLMKVHKEQTCLDCPEISYGSLALSKHMRDTHKKTNVRTDCCPYCAKFVKNLRSHVSVVHKKIKRHYCDICNRGCVTKVALKAHLRVHSGEKPFPCTFPGCDKTFKQSGHVRQHVRIFHGPAFDPVSCEICGKLFKTKYTLQAHRKIHFGSTFKCQKCDSVFSIERYLKEHVKDVHDVDPVVCSDCGKMFKTQKRLQYHRRQHLGTQYICKICDKFFVNKRLLLDHTNSQHDKIRKYLCDVEGCGHAYYRSDNLRKHKRKAHAMSK